MPKEPQIPQIGPPPDPDMDDFAQRVTALDEWMESQGLEGPQGVQLVLFWAAVVLRDQADMAELGQACYEIAQQSTSIYHARISAMTQQVTEEGESDG